MPQRQKILLIILVVVVGYYLYTLIGQDGGGSPVPPVQTEHRQSTPQAQSIERQTGEQSVLRAGEIPVSRTGEQPLAAAQIPLEWRNDPFYREVRGITSGGDSTVFDPLAGLKYTSYGFGGSKKMVFINNAWYEVGDMINGMIIIAADENRVTLEKNARTYHLQIAR